MWFAVAIIAAYVAAVAGMIAFQLGRKHKDSWGYYYAFANAAGLWVVAWVCYFGLVGSVNPVDPFLDGVIFIVIMVGFAVGPGLALFAYGVAVARTTRSSGRGNSIRGADREG